MTFLVSRPGETYQCFVCTKPLTAQQVWHSNRKMGDGTLERDALIAVCEECAKRHTTDKSE